MNPAGSATTGDAADHEHNNTAISRKREPRINDCVHSSVVSRDRDGKPWHVNPIAGCQVVDDVGPFAGAFPTAGDWPKTPEAAWDPALVPARTLAVSDGPGVGEGAGGLECGPFADGKV